MSGLDLALRATTPVPLDLALTVAPGEILALIGRSGAGKSSILKAIAGLLPGGSGHIRVNGESWFDSDAGIRLSPHRRRLGYLFQNYALFPHKTALENVMAAAPDETAARRLLAAVQLGDLKNRRPAQLSGGQQQRVALARALAREPRLLLLDEPFSAVDRPTRRALAQTIRDLRASLDMPVILVTHDIEDAAHLADRIAILEAGRIVQCGPTAEVIARPASELVRDLVA
ncbi:ABC transporter ATP-binding protein [Sandaracinobacteroides hominis]|uniref:ABC transporter ATP-binding protein n=1 Tax=Sandaracinobacteroides hominis TaxID=2780086 RepID=UPI0018F67086|nr:ATP-binding cassette domain-containing protein [Sandaracinobacteroides hominis]